MKFPPHVDGSWLVVAAAVVVFLVSLRGSPRPDRTSPTPRPDASAQDEAPGIAPHGVNPVDPSAFRASIDEEPLVFVPAVRRAPPPVVTNTAPDDVEQFILQHKAQMHYLRELSRQEAGDESTPTLREEALRALEEKRVLVH